jgi:hypothetical protein
MRCGGVVVGDWVKQARGVKIAQGVEGGHAAFPKGKAVGEVEPLYSPEILRSGYLRRFGGGQKERKYERIEAKKAAVEGGGAATVGSLRGRSHRW